MTQNHGENAGHGHATTKSYVTGFLLALILTFVSFGVVMMQDAVSKPVLYTVLALAGIVQMFVHLHYFLHLDWSKEQRWNLIAILFTALLLFIFIGGTIWVMYTLNTRMM